MHTTYPDDVHAGPDLLDLLRAEAHAVDPRTTWVHSVMPNMGYACGGDMVDGLPDGGPAGKWVLGGWGHKTWPQVTCPDCRAGGQRALALRAHRQQSPVGHVCPAPGDTDDVRCLHWQSIPPC